MSRTEMKISEVASHVGQDLGVSDWHEVTQEDINTFANVTHDPQWIHTDPERSAKESPYGGTIAHGFYTLSLLSALAGSTWTITDATMGVNYGLNKVRFPAAVPVGGRIRAHVKLESAEEIERGTQFVNRVTVEIEGVEKPACVAEWVVRVYR